MNAPINPKSQTQTTQPLDSPEGDAVPSNSLFDYYSQTLAVIDQHVQEMSGKFRAHMSCKQRCYGCCLDGFKIRFIEGFSLLRAYAQAPPEVAAAIVRRIQDTGETGKKYCPLLVDGSCSLYANRPSLCRAYGVIVRHEDTLSTCELNFNDVENLNALEALDLPPFYSIIDDLSKLLWQQNPQWQSLQEESDSPPLLSIRDWFELFLSTTTAQKKAQ